jgi:hypothetical protein
VLLHLGVAVLLLRAAAADGRDRSLDHELEDRRESTPEPEALGIEQSDAETLTWIGYEEYQEHLARLSEVEQAAMLASPVAGGGGTPPPSRPRSSPSTPAIPTANLPLSAAPTSTAPAPETSEAEVILDPKIVTEPKTRPTVDPEPVESETIDEATTSDAEATPDPSTRPDKETTTSEVAPEEPTSVPPADEQSEPETDEKPVPTTEADPGPAPEPTPTPTPEADGDEGDTKGDATGEGDGPGEPAPESGNDADKDAEATSLIEVPASEWKQGKPLAARGLNITTRRPTIPVTSWLSYRPKYNPVARIEFDRTGKPKRASLVVRSQEPDLDERLIDMLYRWRAKGSRLKQLTGDQTVTIELQLLLN